MTEVEKWYDRNRRLAQAYSAPIRFLFWLGLVTIGRKSPECTIKADGSWEYIYPEKIVWPLHFAPAWVWKKTLRHPIAMLRHYGCFGVFRNNRGVISRIPGRLLPRRWGFHIMGLIEIGDRG